ncbi:hypothetical protein ACFLZY_00950 [Patescibacteria group bacterium]
MPLVLIYNWSAKERSRHQVLSPERINEKIPRLGFGEKDLTILFCGPSHQGRSKDDHRPRSDDPLYVVIEFLPLDLSRLHGIYQALAKTIGQLVKEMVQDNRQVKVLVRSFQKESSVWEG